MRADGVRGGGEDGGLGVGDARGAPTSPLHLPYISPTSPLHLPCISPTSSLHLPYISPTSPPTLRG